MIYLHSFTHNPFQENTWLLWSDELDCLIIDPGCYTPDEKQELSDFIENKQLKPKRLINTHCHIDHVLGNPYVHQRYGLTPEIHPLDLPLLKAVEQYGAIWGINSQVQPEPLLSLKEGDIISLGNNKLEILFTPGHAPGEISLFCREQNFLIAGDVLFYESIGRTDLPGGNHSELIKTITEKLFSLDDITEVHPGHGPSTTIGHERKYNPYVNVK